MPSSQTVKTPAVIIQSWNDGLFTLREKRNGIARGTSIEEKCMYVLGLGWKFRGSSEIRDSEVENTLYISLSGLTQEAKFLKIGQVLWEQCDERFILKMISSMSNNSTSQSRLYQQISYKETKNFKGYFSRAMNKSMSRSSIDPNSVLNRESKQMASNVSMRKNEDLNNKKKDLERSRVSSKGFENRLLKYRTSDKNIKRLANELDVLLKTVMADDIVEIGLSLGLYLESGFSKSYLIEQIKSIICSYVEFELLAARKSTSKNIYIRQDVAGFDVMMRLLKYTSFSILTSGGTISKEELDRMSSHIEGIRSRMKDNSGLLGGFKSKKLDKKIKERDKFLDKVKKRESRGKGNAVSNIFRKKENKSKFKLKKNTSGLLYKLLSDNIGLGPIAKVGGVDFSVETDFRSSGYTNDKAIEIWVEMWKTDVALARNIASADTPDPINKLKFNTYDNESLLKRLIEMVGAMGIDKSLIPTTKDGLFLPNDPSFYMLAIIRRFAAMLNVSKANDPRAESKKYIKRKKQYDLVTEKIGNNLKSGSKEKKEFDKMFVKGPDGSYSPISIGSEKLRGFYERMQPVYVVGGSVYSFNAGISGGVSSTSGDSSGSIDSKRRKNKLFSNGKAGVEAAFRYSSKKNSNMGAFGTQEAPMDEWDGKEGTKDAYLTKLISGKISTQWSSSKLPIVPSIQPVFLVNKGINTSNIEATALLNLLPSIIGKIPLPGMGAASLLLQSLMQSEIDAAKNLPKFAKGGSFTTNNSNVSQFISGDSINNRINPEKVTIDWRSQRVNVQPLNSTTNNNVTNVETGRITDPIMGTPSTVKINTKTGKTTEAMSVYNSVNPFDENISVGGGAATPMEVLVSLKESLIDILTTLASSNQTEQTHAAMTAKVVDAINNLNGTMKTESRGGSDIFGSIDRLARGE